MKEVQELMLCKRVEQVNVYIVCKKNQYVEDINGMHVAWLLCLVHNERLLGELE